MPKYGVSGGPGGGGAALSWRRRLATSPWRRGPGSPWWRGFAAVLAGALPALAFPAPGLWWFAYVALVPWMLLARSAPTGRRAALDGWLGGMGFVVAVHHWLMPSLHVFIVALAALVGLLWLPWGWLVRLMLGGRPAVSRALAAVAVLPSGWLMVELARSWEGLGGPWGLLGSSQWDVTAALRLASLGGVWLVTLLVVTVNTVLVVLLTLPYARTAAAFALLATAVLAGAGWLWAPRPAPQHTARIAVVQPGIFDGIGSTEQRLARGEELTRALAGQPVDLVVWGESSVGEDLTARPDVARRIAALSRLVGADILVNVDARRSDRPGIFKSSVLVGPQGPTGARYDKMRLVPFGEYVPARALLGWATSVGKAAGEDRMRGTETVVMPLPNGLRLGPLVCFESAFPDMSRRLVRDGAQLLIAQSATSTFQDSWAPGQHASLAALRAAENGRPMVHATLTGVSTVYGPDGARLGEPLGTERSAAAVYDVPLATGRTPYTRFGDWALCAAMAVLALLLASEGLRSLRKPAPEPSVPPARTVHESPERPARSAASPPVRRPGSR
ncbi:apolipoprotein N-acyltransferase [Streptomyces sp. NPDC051561]|uniref:apolipoprotein N-acyltransferase n=1 Tax=Streptomyces sp. NPDC051561 TaxID=3365658 RepID=UPI0037B24EE7